MRRTTQFFSLAARLRRAGAAPLPLLGLFAAIGPLALTSGSEAVDRHPAEVAYRSLPALPEGSDDRSAAGVAETAIQLAVSLQAVPLDALGSECPAADLTVSWIEPGDRYRIGAHVTPIGPEPDATTEAVNGIVVCGGSDYAYMGFEARWEGDAWDVIDVPFVGEEEDEEHLVAQPAPVIPQGPKPVPVLAAPGTTTGPIEGYAAYEPQRSCDPSPKVGTRSLAGALLRDYPGSRNLGIVRSCGAGGRSEHKEGRAFDWGVNIGNPNEKVAAQAFIGALMATDADGNRHALARRMGVMYLIWDRQIWSAYRASEGWRPYSGSSPHRDHVHLSLSWAGANGRTSFWSGTVPADLPTASPVTANVASRRSGSSSISAGTVHNTASAESRRGSWKPRGRDDADDRQRSVHLSRDQLTDGVRELWRDGTPPNAEAIQAWLVGRGVSQDWASQYAAWAAERAAERAARDARRQAERARDDGDDDDDAAAPQRESRRDTDADDDDGDWRAEREAREQAAREAREARRAEWERRQQEARAEREALEQRRREERAAHRAAEEARAAEARAERERRQQERVRDSDDAPPEGERQGRRGSDRRGRWPATTVPQPTTTAPAPTTTAAPPTTVPPTTVVPETTSTTAAETTTTTGG